MLKLGVHQGHDISLEKSTGATYVDGREYSDYTVVCKTCNRIYPEHAQAIKEGSVRPHPFEVAGGCFHYSCIVETANDKKSMVSLTIGDVVSTTCGTEMVSTFIHRDEKLCSLFLRLETCNGHIDVTPDHLISSNGIFVASGDLCVGDTIDHCKRGASKITSINMYVDKGVYAPYTASGTIVVNGFVASCFTNAAPHNVSRVAMTPCTIFGSNDRGINSYASFLRDVVNVF